MKSLKKALVVLSLTLAFCYPASAGIIYTGRTSSETPSSPTLAEEAVLSLVQMVIALV